jgi:peptidylamidoglycolate lyase
MGRYSGRSIIDNFGSGYVTIIDENDTVVSTPGGSEPDLCRWVFYNHKKRRIDTFIHPHDVCVDGDENLYIPQWKSNKTYPLLLERL